MSPLKPQIWPKAQIKLTIADTISALFFRVLQGEKFCFPPPDTWSCLSTKACWLDTQTKRLPEAPSVIILAIRGDPHQDLLPRAERVPQTVQVAVLNVQDCDGSLPGKGKQSTEGLLVKHKQILNSVFVLKTLSFYYCQHLRADTVTLQHHPLLICYWKCWITALKIKLWSSFLTSSKNWFW